MMKRIAEETPNRVMATRFNSRTLLDEPITASDRVKEFTEACMVDVARLNEYDIMIKEEKEKGESQL